MSFLEKRLLYRLNNGRELYDDDDAVEDDIGDEQEEELDADNDLEDDVEDDQNDDQNDQEERDIPPNTLINDRDTIDEITLEYEPHERGPGYDTDSAYSISMASTTTVQEVQVEASIVKDSNDVAADVNGTVHSNGEVSSTTTEEEQVQFQLDLEKKLEELRKFGDQLVTKAKDLYLITVDGVRENEALIRASLRYFVLSLLALFSLFLLVVAYRVGRSFYTLEDTYVCHFLSSVDSMLSTSLASTLCTPFHEDVYTEFRHEASSLLGQIEAGFSSVFRDFCDGVSIMIEVGSAVVGYFWKAISAGLSELRANMTENLTFLTNFLHASWHFILDTVKYLCTFCIVSVYYIIDSVRSVWTTEEQGYFW